MVHSYLFGDTYNVIDTGAILDQVASHLNVIVDDSLQQRSPQVLVLGINLSTSLSVWNQV